MAVTTTKTNKPINPRGNDQSPLAFNRAKLYSGKALDFDGVNDYVDLDGFTMSGTSFSVSFYAKPENAYYFFDSNLPRFLSKYENGFQVYNSIGWTNYGVVPTDSIGFFTIVNEGTTQKAFFNGIQIGNDATITAINLGSTSQFAIGNHYTKTGVPFNGQIAGFKIFNTALTAAQVSDLYNNPEKIVPTGVEDTALKLWLPMMEGAGTTAYDGSGNGNHGTISGATWTHGVGAPVAQSAVIDWNKGTNLLTYSIWNNSYWTASGGVVTDGIEAPDGTNTAFKFERDDASSGTIYAVGVAGLTGANYRYVYAKLPSGSASASAQLMSHNTNTNNTFTITDEWQRFELNSAPNTAPTNFYIVDFRAGVGVDEIHLWAPQAAVGTDESVFVPTIGTAQSSEVLLPQGLTSGRDITGVNLFENVRKQGALNLDGNSWAEVHDNASLDITGHITLEAWAKIKDGMVADGILGRWSSSAGYLLYLNGSTDIRFYIDGLDARYTSLTNGWHHFVGVYDGSAKRLYIDGVQVSSTSQTTGATASTAPIEIGRYQQSTGNTFDDQIAQPRIYNRALTAEEVERNYNAGKNIYK